MEYELLDCPVCFFLKCQTCLTVQFYAVIKNNDVHFI